MHDSASLLPNITRLMRIKPWDEETLQVLKIIRNKAAHNLPLTPVEVSAVVKLSGPGLFKLRRGFAGVLVVREAGPRDSITAPKKHESVPAWEEALLLALLPREHGAAVAGDLEEEFQIRAKRNLRAARLWYRSQVLKSLWPILCRAVRRLWTLGVAVDAVKRWMGW